MQGEHKWIHNQKLLNEIAQNFKQLEEENKELKIRLADREASSPKKSSKNASDRYSKDQEKILKLYSYKTWQEFMFWIDEKLEESGETISNSESDREGNKIKRVLSEILEQPDFEESYTLDKTEQINDNSKNGGDAEVEMEMMAIQNGKLRKENIQLKGKLAEIRALYMKNFDN